MAEIKVKLDLDKLSVAINSVNEKAIKRAVNKSISRTFGGIRTGVTKALNSGDFYDRSKLTAQKAKSRYFVEKKNLGSNVELADMYASMGISSKRIDLINFFAKRVQVGHLAKRQPVKLKSGKWITLKQGTPLYGAQVRMFGRTRFYAGDFIGFVGQSKEQVFRRKDNGKIFKRTGPSMSLLFTKTNAAQRLQNEADARLAREIDHNLDYYLSKI